MDNIILSPINLSQLQLMIQESVRLALNETMNLTKDDPTNGEVSEDARLTIPELASYLKCSLPTIHKYKKDGLIPFYRLGRKVYFKKSEIDASAVITTRSIESRIKKGMRN